MDGKQIVCAYGAESLPMLGLPWPAVSWRHCTLLRVKHSPAPELPSCSCPAQLRPGLQSGARW